MRFKIALIALAVVCILVAPAFSMPQDKGALKHDGCRFPANNLTEAQMNNMTLGELEKLRQQEPANASLNGSCEYRHSQSGNGPHGQAELRPGDNGAHGMMALSGDDSNGSADGAMFFGGLRSNDSPLLLLMSDITADKLGNMTLNQIKALKQEKMNELSNMTLSQIKALEQKNIQERDNMTLGELKNKVREQRKVAQIIGFVRLAGHDDLLAHGSQSCMYSERGAGQGRMAKVH